MIKKIEEMLDITVVNDEPEIKYFNDDYIESSTLTKALKEIVTNLSEGFESLVKETKDTSINNEINNTIKLLELFTLFNTQLTYVKNKVNKLVRPRTKATFIISKQNLLKIIHFDNVMFNSIEKTIKNMRDLLNVPNSDSLNKNYHNDVRHLIKTITDLLKKWIQKLIH